MKKRTLEQLEEGVRGGPAKVFLNPYNFEQFNVNGFKAPYYKVQEARHVAMLDTMPLRVCKKKQQDYELIEKASLVVRDTLASFGYENDFNFDPDHVLFVRGGYIQRLKLHGESEVCKMYPMSSFHKPVGGHIVVHNSVRKDRLTLLQFLLHEYFHNTSVNYGFLTKSDNEWDGTWNQTLDNCLIIKSGYHSVYDDHTQRHVVTNGGEKILFSGLNEAITEELVRESVRISFPKYFPLTYKTDVLKKWDDCYHLERCVLKCIVWQLSDGTDDGINEVWHTFVRHYLRGGSLMHLRKIEHLFGKGSLNILSQLIPPEYASNDTEHRYALKRNADILKYFSDSDELKRGMLRTHLVLR